MLLQGEIDGVEIWPSFAFEDARGQLIKNFGTDLRTSELLKDFTIQEAFFTVSKLNTFRGMHLQVGDHPCNKIISVVHGEVIDILVDLRKESDTFLNTVVRKLDSSTPTAVLVPTGVAHGYVVKRTGTIFQYFYNAPFCRECDTGFNPRDVIEYLKLSSGALIVSDKDLSMPTLAEFLNQ